MEAKDRIIVALDVPTTNVALELAEELAPHVGCFKIGLELQHIILKDLIEGLSKDRTAIDELFDCLAGRIFWDGKFNDIPNTVAKSAKAISALGVAMFTIHASAGRESIRAAVQNKGNSKVLGVTVLTSLSEIECISIFGETPRRKVLQFVRFLIEEGAQGIICSSQEVGAVREVCGPDFLIVVPGIRPTWAALNDQKRVMTPGEAMKDGADYLVIGRPIIDPPPAIGTPIDALKFIADEISFALQERGF